MCVCARVLGSISALQGTPGTFGDNGDKFALLGLSTVGVGLACSIVFLLCACAHARVPMERSTWVMRSRARVFGGRSRGDVSGVHTRARGVVRRRERQCGGWWRARARGRAG